MRLLTTRRVAAAVTTGALAATAFALGAAPAQAATVDNVSLTWGFSATAQSWGITTAGAVAPVDPTAGDGFTTAKGFSLSGGEGTLDDTGTGTVDFTGSVTYSPFAAYGSMVPDKSTVTFADFELDVLSPTEGELSADVSFHKPEADLPATRVTVATFDITSLSTDGGFSLQSASPDWAGTVADGTYAAGYTDAWPTELVDALRTTVSTPASQDLSVYFFRTGNTAGNDSKVPLPISAESAAEEKTVTASAAYGTSGVTFSVTGTGGFTGTDGQPGDAGIYVGLAPAGGLPDVSTQDAMDNFAAAAFVPTAAVQDGGFTATLTPALASDLRRGTAYSLYTWRAHSHSTTSQDTETPVTITWSKITSTVKASVSKSPTPKKAGKLAVTVTGKNGKATGAVTVVLKKGNKTLKLKAVTAKAGKATVTLPKLAKGKWKATVAYAGSPAYLSATKALTLKVK